MLFSVRQLTKTRPQGPGYTLCVPRLDIVCGEKIAITGSSGCGKSTALDLLGLVLRPDAAERFEFSPHGGIPHGMREGEQERARDTVRPMELWERGRHDALGAVRLEHMGYILQTGGLLPFLSVADNLALTARARGLADVPDRVRQLAERLGISRLLGVMPGTLSVGERQRVAIGRALAGEPRVLLADEPTASLDAIHASGVLELLLAAVDEAGMTLLMVTHDRTMVARCGLRELRMRVVPQAEGVMAVLGNAEGHEEAGEAHA